MDFAGGALASIVQQISAREGCRHVPEASLSLLDQHGQLHDPRPLSPNTLNKGHLTLVASSLLGKIWCSLATGYELLSYRVAVTKHHGSRSVNRLEAHLYPSFDI